MPSIVDIPLVDLLVDVGNARLKDEQPSQQTALLAMANQQGKRLLKLAADIVEYGVDPTALPAVVPTDDQKKRYVVLEGNRRLVALKALETPALVAPAFNLTDQRRINNLSKRFAQNPINFLTCVLFESEEEVEHWITLRHTGQNGGVGLVEWGANEQDHYAARHGSRSPAGQIIDFVEKHGLLSEEAQNSKKKIITNVNRLISNPRVRERLGIEVLDKQVFSSFPSSELTKGLTRIVEDLKTEKIKVGDIYDAEDRVRYIESIQTRDLPDSLTRLDQSEPLSNIDNIKANEVSKGKLKSELKPKPKRSQKRLSHERTALIPRSCRLNIDPPRINTIYSELLTLSVDQYPNTCSVIFRVFIELSVDAYIETHKLMTDSERRNTPLAKRLKTVSTKLKQDGRIGLQLEEAIKRIADNQLVLSASTVTFNQYVHNQYVFPKATELKVAWDEVQPLMEELWT